MNTPEISSPEKESTSSQETKELAPVHVMVDIETLDTTPTAVILSIGACTIEVEEPRDRELFYYPCKLEQPNRTIGPDTLEWWVKQVQSGNPLPIGNLYLAEVLGKFGQWLYSLPGPPIMWSKGTDFDIVILRNAMEQLGHRIPWKYNHVRDMRTIKKLFPLDTEFPFVGTPHNALDDAINQALYLQRSSNFHRFALA